LAIRGKVVVGISGGEAGVRGFVDAYDSQTGRRAWRFWTIPGPGEPGHETWSGDAWKTGSGATWVTGSYDPELNLVYWGVGNPGPDWNGDSRPGDNLYTCSLVALDGDTGAPRWHFQFTPHDTHDWDSTHGAGIVRSRDSRHQTQAGGDCEPKRVLLRAGSRVRRISGREALCAPNLGEEPGRSRPSDDESRNRTGGKRGAGLAELEWRDGVVQPGLPSRAGLFYVAVREKGATYYKGEANYKPGTFFAGGGEQELPSDDAWGAIRALEATTGRMVWEFRLHSPPWAGVLSTAGGLVFSGSDEGNFFALDAKTGKPRWDFQTGGPIAANPISFTIDGRQHIAIAADRVLYVLVCSASLRPAVLAVMRSPFLLNQAFTRV
jgi:alcohol dehydrogenase (cytochrome c)